MMLFRPHRLSLFPTLSGLFCQQMRHKTFRKAITKPYLFHLKLNALNKSLGVKTPVKPALLETKFYKVENGMKLYKSVSPGSTHRKHPTRFHLHKGSAIKRLSYGKRSTGGRNKVSGRIATRHRGGGHKKRVRIIDFARLSASPQQIIRFEYDPNRSAELCLLRDLSTNEFSYIIRPKDVIIGQTLNSYRNGTCQSADSFSKAQLIRPGNCLLLKDIPVGTGIHCISMRKDGIAQLVRSAGTIATLLSTGETGMAQVRLTSLEVRMIPVDACATIGQVANETHKLRCLGKAGANRRLGFRPSVRGIAMNPNSHPHGGGRKSKGGKAPRSIWGWKTKGPRTVKRKRWFIVTPRWKAKE